MVCQVSEMSENVDLDKFPKLMDTGQVLTAQILTV
jgi:hypothetical protein